ncbi:MAG: PEGA domain-containing protein [Planctomycetota bacterium]
MNDSPESEMGFRMARVLRRYPFVFLLPALFLIVGSVFMFSAYFLTGKLRLQSDPEGATVFINSRLVGATPLILSGLHPGAYSLRLEKHGYAPLVKSISVPLGDAIFTEVLPPLGVGGLMVEVKPRGAEVLIDGEFLGHTPFRRNDIPIGIHELIVRKTNFKTYIKRIGIETGQCAEFKDFSLEDNILTMLRRACDAENYRIAHNTDLGHYLFVNNELDEAAEAYGKALQIASAPPNFPKDMDVDTRNLETRLRAEDITRLNEEIKKKSGWAGKDVTRFRASLNKQKEIIANANCGEWVWVREQALIYINEDQLDRAHTLYLKHIATAKNADTLSQAYIALLALRIKMRNLVGAKETYNRFAELYGHRADLLRQAGHEVYVSATLLQGEDRHKMLALAENLFRKGIDLTKKNDHEQSALCQFELGNVLCLQNNIAQAALLFRESIDNTRDMFTKELRSQKLVDSLRSLSAYADARVILNELARSPREAIAAKAKADLQELDAIKPSP